MTAEIAVLNRSAVALAADSAVTIGHGQNSKTYLSENKLFEISETKPIGLMIYNSLDFYGYPWEVLVKDFRKAKGDSACGNVSDWTQCFFDWLYTHRMPSPQQQEDQFIENVKVILGDTARAFRNKIFPFVGKPQTRLLREKIKRSLPEVMRDKTLALRELASISNVDKLKAASPDHAKILDETTLNDWLVSKAALIDGVAVERFGTYELDDADKQILRKYVFDVFSRHVCTDDHTGLVFAGFGDAEQFPSLHNVTIDGVIGNRLRCLEGRYYDVDHAANQGTVVPFAQPDVANRFLFGIDDEFEAAIVQYFLDAIADLGPIISSKVGLGSARKKQLRETLESWSETIGRRYLEKASEELKDMFFNSIENMVRLMPKQEMANLAEALVNITIIKRRASAELETVGGPIDVAVISRHEGFVWVKRKHYFDARLNPRFFWRKFGTGNSNSED
ncbi:hypothetical protein [Bradyrhizobium genosp. A]|uniref:hypothetical protein n=1 Tax=Bradyrhizobium genosp. A TaxID=83626 RepID=UPI003CE8BB75